MSNLGQTNHASNGRLVPTVGNPPAHHPLTVGLLQESTRRLYWITRRSVTATDTSFARGWYSRPTVPSSTVSFNESSSQKPPMMENRVNES